MATRVHRVPLARWETGGPDALEARAYSPLALFPMDGFEDEATMPAAEPVNESARRTAETVWRLTTGGGDVGAEVRVVAGGPAACATTCRWRACLLTANSEA